LYIYRIKSPELIEKIVTFDYVCETNPAPNFVQIRPRGEEMAYDITATFYVSGTGCGVGTAAE